MRGTKVLLHIVYCIPYATYGILSIIYTVCLHNLPFRYSRLTDAQVLSRILDVCAAEKVNYLEDGLEAILFTAQGDMRQALNNLQGITI